MNNVSAHRAFSFLRTYGYERVSCSKEERTVAEALLNECASLGVSAQLEEFTVPCGRVSHALLRVTSPYVKEYEVTGYERAASTPEGGLDTEFLYVENADEVLLEQAKGKIVLVNGYLNRATYEKLRKAEAAAILTFTGRTIDRESESDLNRCKLRETLTEPFGAIPVLNMRAASAAEIVRRGAKTVHIELTGECYDGTSQNVCATIPGTDKAEEVITLGGHYDSVYFSSGVHDNLSGSVIVLELLRYFAAHPPRRTLRFCWFGSEEQGLLGSKAYVKAHADELKVCVAMLNFDVAAPTLGSNHLVTLATDDALHYVAGVLREAGYGVRAKQDTYSSDCIPFADNGVPAINLARFGANGADYMHNRHDSLKSGYLDEHALDITLQQGFVLLERLANAASFPIKREITPEIRQKVDEYLFKAKKE